MNLGQDLGHKKLNFLLAISQEKKTFMLQLEPHPQLVEESYNLRHYGASYDYRKTL